MHSDFAKNELILRAQKKGLCAIETLKFNRIRGCTSLYRPREKNPISPMLEVNITKKYVL